MNTKIPLLSESKILERIFDHIDNKTTDLGDTVWKEPVANYVSEQRFDAEIALLRRLPVVYCLSAMLPDNGSYVARKAAGSPLLVVRGDDGKVRAFINGCRHRGMQVAKDSGCARAFVCPYHAWTYGLDGELRNIPGRAGFPGVELQEHGLVEALEDLGLELAARLAEGLRCDHLGLGRGLIEHAIELIEFGLQGGAWLIQQEQDEVLESQVASAGKVLRVLAVGIDEGGAIK